MIYNVRVHVG